MSAAGSWSGRSIRRMPRADPPRLGLTTMGRPSSSIARSRRAPTPSSRRAPSVSGKADGTDRPARKDRLGGQLVEGETAGIETGTRVWKPEKLENRRDRPILPETAMKRQEGDVEGPVVEPLNQFMVGVQLAHPVAPLAEGVGDPLARAER